MRTILVSALAAAMAFSASATTFKEKFHLDAPLATQRELPTQTLTHHRLPATQSADGLVTDPAGTISRYAMAVDIFLSHMGATHVGGFGAQVITDDDSFFSRAFTLNYFQQGYSEGKIEGDKVVFTSGQYVYNTQDGEKAYMYAAYLDEEESWPTLVDTFTLTKDEKGRYVSEPGYYFMVMTEEEAQEAIDLGSVYEDTDIICFGLNYVFTPLPADIAENVPPADADFFECQLIANSLYYGGALVSKDITVSVSGDNIYIGGLSDYLPTAYLMGTKTSDNTYTFNTNQYIGYFDEGDYPYIFEFAMVNPFYFTGESVYFDAAESITMTINDERNMLTIEEDSGIFICSYGDINTWNDVYWNMMIGDFNRPLTPQPVEDVNCYSSWGAPYVTFEWSNISMEGIPMNGDNLWCEVILNGEPYVFSPEYHEGLSTPTDRVYYNTSEVDGLYPGDFSTLYLNELEDSDIQIKSLGIKVGYEGNGEITYTDIVYAKGYEPIEDKAFIPSKPGDIIYYKDYYNNILFTFDGKDTEGNDIPERLLAVEILLDGSPLVFPDDNYYFHDGSAGDITIIGLAEYSVNYNSSLVTKLEGNRYMLSLWGHDAMPEFKTIAVRAVCTGGDTLTYGESCENDLERAAMPADPWNVTYDSNSKQLKFGALPLDTEGNGLAPWLYGYEVYVDDQLYTFKSDLYDLESDITVIPYEGFEYNYNFYLYSQSIYDETTWTVIDKEVVMEVDMDKEGFDASVIGVRAVYTDGEGNTTYSSLVNSDGTVGINAINNGNEPVKWYNLQGIEVSHPTPGEVYLRKQGNTTTKVYVK